MLRVRDKQLALGCKVRTQRALDGNLWNGQSRCSGFATNKQFPQTKQVARMNDSFAFAVLVCLFCGNTLRSIFLHPHARGSTIFRVNADMLLLKSFKKIQIGRWCSLRIPPRRTSARLHFHFAWRFCPPLYSHVRVTP